MEVNEIGQLISQYGFPIVTAAALFWYMVKEQRGLRSVIEENTKMLSRILEHMKTDEKKHMEAGDV